MQRVLRWVVIVLVGGGVVGGVALALRPSAIDVETRAVVLGPMLQTVREEGQTRIRERYVVSSPLTGRVRRITLDPGDSVVAEETVLGVLEPTDPELLDPRALAEAQARVLAAEAAVRRGEANLRRESAAYDLAEIELGRISEAVRQGGGSKRELDEAQTEERTASESRRAATFALEIDRYELEVARSALLYAQGGPDVEREGLALRSPIDGVVLRVFQESAGVVAPGAALLEIGDPRDLELVIDVLSTDAVKIHPGDRVVIEHWGGSLSLEGRVRLVEPSAFTKVSALGIEEQRVNVIADLVTPIQDRSTLGDQFRIEAAIVIWEGTDVLVAPTSAIFRSGDGWAAYGIVGSRAELRAVQIGRQSNRETEILSGLEAGEMVVLHPSDKLKPGSRVKPVEPSGT